MIVLHWVITHDFTALSYNSWFVTALSKYSEEVGRVAGKSLKTVCATMLSIGLILNRSAPEFEQFGILAISSSSLQYTQHVGISASFVRTVSILTSLHMPIVLCHIIRTNGSQKLDVIITVKFSHLLHRSFHRTLKAHETWHSIIFHSSQLNQKLDIKVYSD